MVSAPSIPVPDVEECAVDLARAHHDVHLARLRLHRPIHATATAQLDQGQAWAGTGKLRHAMQTAAAQAPGHSTYL
jgi:L-aminopeptidase/D-esterase-like protein